MPAAFDRLAQHLLDGQVAGVEYQVSGVVGDPVEAQVGAAAQLLVLEVHAQVEADVGDAHTVRLGVGTVVHTGLGSAGDGDGEEAGQGE